MNRPARHNAVIFDLGNVVFAWNVDAILNSLELDAAALNLLREELFAHQDWLDLDHGKISETAVVAKVCARSPLDRETVNGALLAAKNSLAPIPESIALMREISDRGIEIFCLSNMSRETYEHIRGDGLFELFSGIAISGIEGCMKPNDDIYHLILERYELQPAGTLFIDDSRPNIDTAVRIGIEGFHFKGSADCYAEIRKLLR